MCASASQAPPHPYYTLRLGGVVQSIQFAKLRENEHLMAGGSKGEVWLVSMGTKRPVWVQECHSGNPILQVDILAEGIAMTYGKDQWLCVWDFSEKGLSLRLSIRQEQYSYCNFSTLPLGEGECLACMPGSEHSVVRVLRLEEALSKVAEVAVLSAEKAKECASVKLARREGGGAGVEQVMVVAAFLTGHVIIWELETASVLFIVDRMLDQEIVSMDLDADRMMGIVGGAEGALGVFRVKKKETNEEAVLHDILDIRLKNMVNCVRLRGDNKVVACAGTDHGVSVLSWKSLKLLAQLQYHEDTLSDVRFGTEAGENVLAVSSRDKRISLWKLY